MADDEAAPAIVWFRDDLRLSDNPALNRAVATGRPLICVYIFDDTSADIRPLGGAARWMLHQSLNALEASLRQRGGTLVLMRGAALEIIERIARQCAVGACFWNRRYGAAERAVDSAVKSALAARGILAQSDNCALLREPWTIKNQAGEPYRVFSAYWRACERFREIAPPTPAPKRMEFHAPPDSWRAVKLADLALLPTKPDWPGGLGAQWPAGETAAQERLAAFLDEGLNGYASGRDRPDKPNTSRLSPYLRSGAISARQIWHAAQAARHDRKAGASDCDKFLAELGWRDFSYHLLFHFPDLATRNFQSRFDCFAWREDPEGFDAWRRGRTGYPLVDAGMRELWATGAMHNRVRMAVASFLIKHLLIDWRLGAEWFWDTLVDADPASNAASWQWVAGSGVDAAPYYRIFNPVLQGEKFDPDGAYVKRWVPELAKLPPRLVHRPWSATPAELANAGLGPGVDYPRPIVDHDLARKRALATFAEMNSGADEPRRGAGAPE
jgi:deoxyribodipyrimidine photo-lyase